MPSALRRDRSKPSDGGFGSSGQSKRSSAWCGLEKTLKRWWFGNRMKVFNSETNVLDEGAVSGGVTIRFRGGGFGKGGLGFGLGDS